METTQLIPSERTVYSAEIVDDLEVPALSQPATPVWERRDVVVGLIAISGPPGLLMLWLSRRFAQRTKLLITLGYFALTVVFPIAMIWYWCNHALTPLVKALNRP